MLAKKFRLRSADFKKEKGKAIKAPHLLFRVQSTTFPFSRFAVVVPKSIDRRATRRNALRRAIYRNLHRNHLHHIAGYDIVIYGLRGLNRDRLDEEMIILKQYLN